MRKILLSLVFLSSFLYMSAQNNAQSDALAKQLVTANATAIGMSQYDLTNYIVSSSYFNETGNTQMVYLLQGYKGLPVWNQMLVLAFRDGKLLSKAGGFLPNMDQLTSGRSATASVSAANAVRAAFTESNLAAPVSITARYTPTNTSKKIDFGTLGMAKENITAELMWVPVMNGANMTGVKLAWQVELYPLVNSDYWRIHIDASNSAVVNKTNLTVYENYNHDGSEYLSQDNFLLKNPEIFKGKTFTPESALSMFSVIDETQNHTNNPSLVTTANYTVIKYPAEAPSFPGGAAAVHTNPWLLAGAGNNAITLGWHNDGALDYIASRGNNVHAHEDRLNNNSNAGLMATSTTSPDPLNFTYAGQPDYTAIPTTPLFQQFAITQLFYWNNIMHDITYKYGFTETGFNFQNNNLGRGGAQGDYVQADAQDGGGVNNANFATPGDGVRPRMQMYLFNPAAGILTFVVNSPASIAGPYTAIEGAFSTANLLGNVGPRTANLVWYNDDATGVTHYACNPAFNAAALSGKIALIVRGFGGPCPIAVPFTQKVTNAQLAGAIGVVVVNNVPGPPIVMGGGPDPTIITPAIMISDVDGATIAAQITNPFVNVTMSSTPPGTVQLDGDIDNGVVSHEFFHGVSNRLTGGGTSGCLGNAEQGGEGWGDINALFLTTNWATAVAADGFNKKRPVGTYAFGQAPTGGGIRLYPYCTNMAINPLTYASMGVAPVGTEVHNIGEIWCMALWEMTWQLIQTNGINADLYNNAGTQGNTVAYKLIMEGMRLQPCNPGYIDARNAILQADQNLYAGIHVCDIWTAFAKRGMGFSASQGSSNSATDQTPAFDLPPGAAFTTQPANTTTCVGSNASFTAVAAGATYQWQVSTAGCGGPWTNLTNVAPYSGVTTSTLAITSATLAMNGYAYRAVGTTTCGSSNSNCAVLTVVAAAVGGTVTPANTNVCATPNSTLLTLTGNVGPVTRWESSTTGCAGVFSPIAGTAGLQTYTATNVAVTTAYRAFISAVGCASATSTCATVTVLPGALPMFIVADPGTTVCAGDPTRLTVMEGASVTGPLYTQTAAAVNGAPSQNFETANDAFDCSGADDFTVGVGATWTVTQVNVTGTLSLAGPPASFNVIFYNNTGGLPGSVVQAYNNVATFTGAAGSYNITLPSSLALTAGTYWVSVQVNMNFTPAGQWFWSNFGGANIGNASAWQNPGGGFAVGCTTWGNTCAVGGSNRNHIFTIVGSSVAAPVIVTGGTFLWSPAAGLSSTSTNPVAASPAVTTTYTVTHNNGLGCIRTAQITINVNTRPTVTTHPSNTNVCTGSQATFTAAGTGTGLTYQWQVSINGGVTWNNVPAAPPYTGTTGPTLTINPTSAAMNGYRYRVVLSGTCPPAIPGTPNISNSATLTLTALPTVTITPAGPVCGGIPGVNGVMLTTGGTSLPPIPGSLTVNSGTINVAIPEGAFPAPPATAGVSTVAVSGIPANATITNISVKSNITHAYVGDVVMVLKAANGAVLNLDAVLNKTNNAGANFVNTTISSAGVTTLDNGVAPGFTGTFKADAVGATFPFLTFTLAGGPVGYTPTTQTWSTLYPSPNGNWTLAMYDAGAPDVGNLTSWEIKIDYTTPNPAVPFQYVWSPAAGLYLDPTASTPYVAGSSQATVYAAPTVNTLYTVTITDNATLCTNTATVQVNYTPNKPTVNPTSVAMCLGDAPVPITVTSSLAPTTVTLTTTHSPALAIPDNTANGVQSVINVAGVPAGAIISAMSITLDMPHTYPADMVFNLKAPNGVIYNLYKHNTNTDNGAASIPTAGFYNAVINNSSAVVFSTVPTPYRYGITAPAGPYKPDGLNVPLVNAGYTIFDPAGFVSTATNMNQLWTVPNGAWTLAMCDGGPLDFGALNSWTLSFTYGTPSVGVWSPVTGLWTNAAGTTPYTGTPIQTVYAQPLTVGVNNYAVTVSTGTCTSAPTIVPVTVNAPVAITSVSANAVVCTNNTTSFTVVATGSSLTYQWQVSTNGGTTWTNIANGAPYSGATTATLTITAPSVTLNGSLYRVVVSGGAPCPSVNSASRSLTVNPLPTVSISAAPYQALYPGLTTTITVNSSPAAATYVWRRNGVVIPGATAGSYVADIDHLGNYVVTVTDVNGCVGNSNTLTIGDSTSGRVFIYPNPNSGRFQVRYNPMHNAITPYGLKVFDAMGKLVLNQKYTLGVPYAPMMVDLSNMATGVYWVEVVDIDDQRLAMGRCEILR